MAFNITSRALADSTVLHLVDPGTGEYMYDNDKDGKPDESKPLTIELYGRSSKQYRQWMSATLRKQQKEKEANKGKEKLKALEDTLADNAEFLAIVTIKVNNFELGTGPIDSKEKFVEMYANPSLDWIGDQVSAALQDNANFLK